MRKFCLISVLEGDSQYKLFVERLCVSFLKRSVESELKIDTAEGIAGTWSARAL